MKILIIIEVILLFIGIPACVLLLAMGYNIASGIIFCTLFGNAILLGFLNTRKKYNNDK